LQQERLRLDKYYKLNTAGHSAKRKDGWTKNQLIAEKNRLNIVTSAKTSAPIQQAIIRHLMKDAERRWIGENVRVGAGNCSCGHGEKKDKGLYDDQLEKMMKMYQPEFKGVIARDEIKTLLPKIQPKSRVGFILNLDPADKAGSHWVAIFIDARSSGSKSIEYFDSFGRVIPDDILKDLKLLVEMLQPGTLLKLKSNHVVMQDDKSSNCGYFAMRFLIDRFRGVPFSDATGFNGVW